MEKSSAPTARLRKRRRTSRIIDTDLAQRVSKRRITVYDAVAGRVTARGHRDSQQHRKPQYWADHISGPMAPITPLEALFKVPDAPELYEEKDLYGAHRWLSDPPQTSPDLSLQDVGGRGRLPESDLLKAIHEYTSEFYASSTVGRGRYDWYSMDETALLAMGILMEEEVARMLGENGWAVFTEPAEDTENATGAGSEATREPKRSLPVSKRGGKRPGAGRKHGSLDTVKRAPHKSKKKHPKDSYEDD